MATPLYNRLVNFSKGTTTIAPSLAESWEISKDGLVYTFHLRKGVKFHTTAYFKPTRDFNADDVLFTFNRMMNPQHPFNKAYPAEFPYFIAMGMDKNLKQIAKTDPYTVTFTLRQAEAAFIQNMAMEFAAILSAEYADQLLRQGKASLINQKPIGTGPFVLKQYVKDQQIRYTANKAYWDHSKDGSVLLDGVVISISKEAIVGSKKLLAGECHTVDRFSTVPINEIAKFKQNSAFMVHEQPEFSTTYLSYNTQKPIFRKAMVRQALDMALNKEALLKPGRGLWLMAVNPMPPNQWSYDPSLKNAPYDPIKAKALLKAAGYPKGFKLKFFINLGKTPSNTLIAQMIQADWKKIGVSVELVSYDGGEFWKRAANGEHDVLFSRWVGDNGDPDNWLGPVLGCGNASNHTKWCYKPFNDLLLKARYEINQAERTKLYQEAQKIVKREVPLSPIIHSLSVAIYNKKVKFERSYIVATLGCEQYTGITIE